MKKYWLIFAQTTTILLAAFFTGLATKPYWEPSPPPSPSTSIPPSKEEIQMSFSQAAQRATPSIVNIYTVGQVSRRSTAKHTLLHQFQREHTPKPDRTFTLGSGVIVHQEGYIVTNSHVVRYADQIEVVLSNGKTIEATVIGKDLETDLAVIKVGLSNLPAIEFARLETLKVGDITLAIGNPFGIGQTVSQGVISAIGRSGLNISAFENFIQTDAAINPGNSGGALVNLDGQLIGINTNIMSLKGSDMGIGFAIPANTVKQVVEEIIRTGTVTRGWIGIQGQDMSRELAQAIHVNQETGVLITSIMPNQPADQAHIIPGDILIAVNQKPIKNFPHMNKTISGISPGTTAKITLVRDNVTLEQEIIIGRRPPRDPDSGAEIP